MLHVVQQQQMPSKRVNTFFIDLIFSAAPNQLDEELSNMDVPPEDAETDVFEEEMSLDASAENSDGGRAEFEGN